MSEHYFAKTQKNKDIIVKIIEDSTQVLSLLENIKKMKSISNTEEQNNYFLTHVLEEVSESKLGFNVFAYTEFSNVTDYMEVISNLKDFADKNPEEKKAFKECLKTSLLENIDFLNEKLAELSPINLTLFYSEFEKNINCLRKEDRIKIKERLFFVPQEKQILPPEKIDISSVAFKLGINGFLSEFKGKNFENTLVELIQSIEYLIEDKKIQSLLQTKEIKFLKNYIDDSEETIDFTFMFIDYKDEKILNRFLTELPSLCVIYNQNAEDFHERIYKHMNHASLNELLPEKAHTKKLKI